MDWHTGLKYEGEYFSTATFYIKKRQKHLRDLKIYGKIIFGS